jgi:hypothetical protein
VIVIPMLLYGSQCWKLMKEQMRGFRMAEMHFLIAVIGYRMRDHKHNDDTRL